MDRVTEGLLRLAGRIGQPSVLITTDDAGAIFLAEHGRDLRRWFLFPDRQPFCHGGWPASTRYLSSAASSGCPRR